MESCTKHPHEKSAALCQRCGMSWCNDCLVFAFGPKKPPMCLECAMFAGGVRSAAVRPAMPKRELKARLKAFKAHAKAAADGEIPFPLSMLQRFPALQGVPARLIAIGPLPEHAPEWARRSRPPLLPPARQSAC